jgi:hypothetical protein
MEAPREGVVKDEILPPPAPVSSLFGKVAKLSEILTLSLEPRYGDADTVITNGVVGITARLWDMPLGEGKTTGAARVCPWHGGNCTRV